MWLLQTLEVLLLISPHILKRGDFLLQLAGVALLHRETEVHLSQFMLQTLEVLLDCCPKVP